MARKLACFLAIFAGACTTVSNSPMQPFDASMQLVSVNGKNVSEGFRLSFDKSGTYHAKYGCGDHFGRYTIDDWLSFHPDASTGENCDFEDIATGQKIPTSNDMAVKFFADGNFEISELDEEMTFKASGTKYTFRKDD